jgi:hypothetical protein
MIISCEASLQVVTAITEAAPSTFELGFLGKFLFSSPFLPSTIICLFYPSCPSIFCSQSFNHQPFNHQPFNHQPFHFIRLFVLLFRRLCAPTRVKLILFSSPSLAFPLSCSTVMKASLTPVRFLTSN